MNDLALLIIAEEVMTSPRFRRPAFMRVWKDDELRDDLLEACVKAAEEAVRDFRARSGENAYFEDRVFRNVVLAVALVKAPLIEAEYEQHIADLEEKMRRTPDEPRWRTEYPAVWVGD